MTHDYGLRLFWSVAQDEQGVGAHSLSTELHDLVIKSLLEIFSDGNYVKSVRSLYLIKAIKNILSFRSMH